MRSFFICDLESESVSAQLNPTGLASAHEREKRIHDGDDTFDISLCRESTSMAQLARKCRMCKQTNETISHIVSGWPKLAQKEYKKMHDNLARAVHWNPSEKYGFERSERWYDHAPDSVLENEDYKMLGDLSVQKGHEIEARRPDLLIIDKNKKSCQIIDLAIPEDGRVRKKRR